MSKYLIKKGNHYASGLHLGVHFGITEQKYRVKFSKECLYSPDWENDWNKLCGWSYGLHHNNSIRVGWRPYVKVGQTTQLINTSPTQIELCIYVYENGVRNISESTIVVDVDKVFELFVYRVGDKLVLSKNYKTNPDEYISMQYFTKPLWGYRLYPYIGGNNVAEVDTVIEVNRL